jgi:hypothetical protein
MSIAAKMRMKSLPGNHLVDDERISVALALDNMVNFLLPSYWMVRRWYYDRTGEN